MYWADKKLKIFKKYCKKGKLFIKKLFIFHKKYDIIKLTNYSEKE